MAGRLDENCFETAEQFYLQALEVLPLNAANELAVTHNALGVVYANAGMFEASLSHYQEAISYIDTMDDLYRAAWFRFNVAKNLANMGRLSDALEYARYALEKFEACGSAGVEKIQETQDIIAKIEEILRTK